MAGNVYFKNIRRTITGSFGRYIAILAIIALGVGFFVGVKDTKASMMETCNNYVSKFKLFDYRLISTYGFTEDEIAEVNNLEEVEIAEGSITADFFSVDKDGDSITLRAHAVSDKINKVDLQKGRMPENSNECVVDDYFYSADDIGRTIAVTDENDKDTKETLTHDAYKIVGIAKSPYYLTKNTRGTTSLGDGQIDAFIYVPEEGLSSEYFTEMFVVCKDQGFIFSDEYEANMEAAEEPVTETAEYEAKVRYDELIAEAEAEIADGQKELDDGRATLNRERASAYAELSDAKKQLDDKSAELSDGKKELKSQKKALKDKRPEAEEGLAAAEEGLQQAQAGLKAAKQNPYTPPETITELEGQVTGLQAAVKQAKTGLAQIDAGLETIAEKEKELVSGEKQLQDGYEEYRDGLAEAEREFANAEAELADGEKELEDAREELAELKAPEIIVQTREDNLGFGSFESNADIVDSIAKVFPVFFFLIAALVCSTTMSRMIEEERTQIGALRALGYTSGKIMLKYMIYSGSAAVIGCLIGFFAGSKYFPLAIWIAYGMMFGFAPLEFYFSWQLAIVSLAVSLLCSTGTTYFACRGQLKDMPAEILRPRAPKAGKRIVLERIGFIWNHLKFLHKVSARNVLRYKKRMFMMMAGIGGCAALVLAGFGIDDSVAGIGDHQYDRIQVYDMLVAFDEEVESEKRADFEKEYDGDLKNLAVLQQTSVTLSTEKAAKSCNLMITDDSNINKAISFHKDEKTVPYPKVDKAMLSNKMADMLGVQEGDMIDVEYDDTKCVTLTVSGIYRNYVDNYMFISAETYENTFHKEYEPSMMYVTFKKDRDVHKLAEQVNDFDGVIAVSLNEDAKENIDVMMESLNYIVILVILCAGALAFIVLFNLSNINITERVREIATIEVLGFYPRETGAYVFRENFILVLMGIAVGLPMGYVLHKFIMTKISVDYVSFNEVIEPTSYLYAIIAVLCFTFIVDIIMRRKLRKINMAEALKSVE